MAGTMLSVGVLGAGMILFGGFAASGAATVTASQTAYAADAAALSAAMVQEGFVAGEICAQAAAAARANGASLIACASNDGGVTVRVHRQFGMFTIERQARAGRAPVVNN